MRQLPAAGQVPASSRTRDALFTELREVRDQLGLHEPIVEALRARRDELYLEAREGMSPPVPKAHLAREAGVSESAIQQSLKAIEKRRQAQAS